MALIVQKYGGTSVGNVDRIQNVAAKIKEQWSKGNRLVVVVSARSGVTNDLIARAKALMPLPDEREMDVLMAVGEQETIALTVMALHAIGVPAVSRTGAQAGIFTDDIHTRARITRITGGDLLERLDEAKSSSSRASKASPIKVKSPRSVAGAPTLPPSPSPPRSRPTFARSSPT
jgi:aspartate kinase